LPTDQPPIPSPDWRDTIVLAAGLNLVAGIWLIIAPWVVGYTDADAWWNPIIWILGVIVVSLAVVGLTARRAS
jgi:hypothetical protein